MRIYSKRLILLVQRYRISINDLAEMLCVYPERVQRLLKQSIIELDEEQATNLVQWFGARDALAIMERKQMHTVISIVMI